MAALSSSELAERDDLLEKSKADGSEVTLSQIQEHDDAAKSHALTANVLLGVGIAAAATGGVLWYLGRDARPAVAVTPTDGGIGIVVGGRL